MKPAAFSASYADWRLIKGRKVIQIVMEVPLEKADEAYAVLGGMPNAAEPAWFGIAKLKADAEVAAEKVARPKLPPEKRLTQRVAICCADPMFARFIDRVHAPCRTSEEAAAFVRQYCGVSSRSEIVPGSAASITWDLLHSHFVIWRDHPELAEIA